MFHFNRCITEWDCQVPLGPLIFHGGKLQLQKTENNHKETKKNPQKLVKWSQRTSVPLPLTHCTILLQLLMWVVGAGPTRAKLGPVG